ncbi:MAG: cyclic nucleotide-binding domain-containing protein [Amphritea sp.]
MHTLKGDQLIEELGLDYFKQGSTLGALSDKAIIYLLEQGEVIQLEKGDRLFEIGDPGDHFYIVLKGTIQFVRFKQGKIACDIDFAFGEELGYAAMIALHNRLGNAQVREDSIVLKVSNAFFYELHETQPADFEILQLNLSREMARRFRAII